MIEINKIYNEDCLTGLKQLPDKSINCCITSPPYYGLRDYGHAEQIGLEETPEAYVSKLVEVFTEVKRVLRDDGVMFLNLGDSYFGSGKGGQSEEKRSKNWQPVYGKTKKNDSSDSIHNRQPVFPIGQHPFFNGALKPKDLIGIPWLVAFALRSSGWYLRQDIIWHKPNPMPESVTDRCTKSHEYIFLMSKSAKYYYDAEAIKKPVADASVQRLMQDIENQNGSDRVPGKTNGAMKAVGGIKGYRHRSEHGDKKFTGHSGNFDAGGNLIGMANKRSVWTVTTKPYSESHFATFPEDLITDCIKAGCPVDGLILDPFMGAGTTALVASKLTRNFIGFELNEKYIQIAEKRLRKELGMFNPMNKDCMKQWVKDYVALIILWTIVIIYVIWKICTA